MRIIQKSIIYNLKSIYKWFTATRLRRVLSSILAVLIFFTGIRFIFLKPKEVKAADIYLGFDEGYGTSSAVHDTNSNISAGSITGAVWKNDEYCKTGKCLYFDGTDDYVQFADNSNLDFAATDDFSVQAWFRHPTTMNASDEILSKREDTGTDGGYDIKLNNSGQIVCQIEDDDADTGQDGQVTSPLSYNDNKWHQTVCVYDGQVSLTLYIDGVQIDQTTSVSSNTTLANDDPLFIGVFDTGLTVDYEGFIDEVKIYRSARTTAEVKADFAGETASRGTSASFGPDQTYLTNGLVGYWKLDENTGTSTSDSSGNSNTETLSAASWSTGKFGSGWNGDGGKWITTGADDDDFDFTGGDGFTYSVWFKSDSATNPTNNEFLIDKENASAGYDVVLYTNGQIGFEIDDDASSFPEDTVQYGTDVYDATWHHVVAVKRGTNKIEIYVDGVLSNTNSTLSATGSLANTDFLAIGAQDNVAGNDEFTGDIDSVRVYNRALSPSEVQKLYNWAPDPLVHLKLDENSGSTVYDSSGNFTGISWSGTGTQHYLPGKYGPAGNFNATDDYVDVGDISSKLNLVSTDPPDFTFEQWLKIDPNSTDDAGSQLLTSNARLIVSTISGCSTTHPCIRFQLKSGGTTVDSPQVSYNVWYHAAGVYTKSNHTIALYLNGVLQGSTVLADFDLSLKSNGMRVGFNQWNFGGEIDDVRVYNYARTAGQIIEDMNGGHPAPGSPVGSPVGYWEFDEGNSDTLNNSGNCGSACNLTRSGATKPSWTNSGKIGKALNFGGTTAWAAPGSDVSQLKITGDLTLSAWINLTNTSSQHDIISKYTGTGATSSYRFFVDNTGKLGFTIVGVGPSTFSWTGNKTLSASTWYHVAAVFKSGTNTTMYINGLQDVQNTTTVSTLNDPTTLLNVGGENAGSNLMNGLIDEAQVYNTAFTSDQIKSLYNQGSMTVMGATSTDSSGNATWSDTNAYCPPGQGSSCTAPVAEWKLDEKTGTAVNDTTGNGNTGTITSNSWGNGKFGAAFDGDDSTSKWVCTGAGSCADDDDFDFGTGSFSISLWYKGDSATNPSNQEFIVSKENTTTQGYDIKMGSNGKVAFAIDDDIVYDPDYSAGSIASQADTYDGFWHHLEAVKNGTSSISIYSDGVLVETVSPITNATATLSNGLPFYLGSRTGSAGGTDEFQGDIDNVRIYNYARSQDQVAWDYNRGGPVAWYQMDESSWNGTAGEVKDASGNNNHGVRNNQAAITTSGKFNNAGTFDGTTDYVSVTDPGTSALDITGQMTVSAWIYKTGDTPGGGWDDLVTKADTSGSPTNYWMQIKDVSNVEYLDFYFTGGGYNEIRSTTPISLNTWTHVAVTYDDAANNIIFYVNGVATGETNLAGDLQNQSMTANNNDLRIGQTFVSQDFQGNIDDVRIYNYALTPQQVKMIMNDGSALKFGPVTGSP